MTGCEVRVEAWLRGYLPEGPVESFTPQQGRVHNAGLDWGYCIADFGAEHPATLGCLLALVREAWGSPDAFARKTEDGRFWGVRCPGFAGYMGRCKATEAEALVAALEAAP